MKSGIGTLCTVILAVLLGTTGICLAVPPIPAQFYGSISIDGNPAPAGTMITALINGQEKGSLITTVDGYYGGLGIFDDKLTVTATEEEYSGGFREIIFQIGGVRADQTATYDVGAITQLDLTTGGTGGGSYPTAVPAQQGAVPPEPDGSMYLTNQSLQPGSIPAGTDPGVLTPGPAVNGSPGLVDNYSSPRQSGDNSEPPSIQTSGSHISYGLDANRVFSSDDGLAGLSFEKGTMIFTQTGQYLQQVSVKARNIPDLPREPDVPGMKFTGYAYEVTPGNTYFNPKGILILHLPPERSFDIVNAKPVIYEFIPQIGSWQPVYTESSHFTGEVRGDVYEAASFALFIPNTTTTNSSQGNLSTGMTVSSIPVNTTRSGEITTGPGQINNTTVGTPEFLTPIGTSQVNTDETGSQNTSPTPDETEPGMNTSPVQPSSLITGIVAMPGTIAGGMVAAIKTPAGFAILLILTGILVNVIIWQIYTRRMKPKEDR